MKKIITKILIALITIAIVIAYTVSKYKNNEDNNADYSKSIYIITDSKTLRGNDYYEVNDNRKVRVTDNFIPDESERYFLKDCFVSHADVDVGKILNDYKEDNCKVTNDEYMEDTLDETMKEMLNVIANKLYNQIKDVNIYKVNDHYYTSVEFILNTHTSYKFYYYDKDKKKLNHICTFNDKYVSGVKEKEPFIFGGE